MANKTGTRIRLAWKAFSVQALALIASQELWFPYVQALAVQYFGPDAQSYISAFLALAGILGWIKPQRKLNDEIQKPEPWDVPKR